MTADDKPIGLMRLEIKALKSQVEEALGRLEELYWACENCDGHWTGVCLRNAGKTLRKFGRIEDEEEE